MAKKTQKKQTALETLPSNVRISGAGLLEHEAVTDTLKNNYMPYAMSVILSRAIPEIDGFKPSHRKLLYTMYKQGLLTGARTKSANIVGATMKLNPHGDAAIYDTMVRLAVGHEALLHPFVDSKGNFGKFYSTNMEYAAYRYTEAKLAPIAAELFRDIDKDTVDFVDNYDATTTEPTLFPVTFPSILVNNNLGIAVGMASQICSFNLSEVCETTIALMKNPDHNLLETMPAPDFPGGGTLIYDPAEMAKIYKTGRGSFRVRSNYTYDKENNCIDVTEIPYTTNLEAIIAKVVDLVKAGKIKEINDIRNETGKAGLKITIDLKRGVDPEKLMARLFALTPLEDSFSCNFNVLCGGMPQVLGVRELLDEWTAFRTECVRRRTYFDLSRAKEKLHLLKGLQKILLDIDKAVQIVRSTDEESEVVPNLMIGFGIDQIQAEYVAEIKLRHFNREYILKRLTDIEDLEKNIADMEDILKSRTRVRNIIIDELKQVAKKHGQPRRTQILYAADVQEAQVDAAEEIDAYPCTLFFTKEGYFKKIQPNSLRMSSEHKFKENDRMLVTVEATNAHELLFFSNGASCYKAHAYDFADTKASVLGDFVATKLSFDAGETAIHMVATTDFAGYLLFFFENGKVAKVPLSAYDTKSNRKKLVGAYSDKSPLVAIYHIKEDGEFLLSSTSGRRLLLHSGALSPKTTRNTQGVQVMTLKGAHRVEAVVPFEEGMVAKPARYRTKNIPAAGATLAAEDVGEQLTF
ncbi:MAG: DNA topoisomerase (ATP-hydrolyzing) subunit A [Clostridia bacterium]|nr:DNA topoisomerase (ATP-hydrolyzing) subunit A [Clostridia bacterium]